MLDRNECLITPEIRNFWILATNTFREDGGNRGVTPFIFGLVTLTLPVSSSYMCFSADQKRLAVE